MLNALKGRLKMFYWLPLLIFLGSQCWTPADSRVIHKRAAFYIANETMCIVDGDVYFNGDPVPTDDECERCTCRPPGFSCVLRDCDTKPGCKAVRKAGECCPEYLCGCVHNNRLYEDGELIKDLQNNCYTCRCHGSSISCIFADCRFRGDCQPDYVPGECCPRYDHCPTIGPTTTTTTTTTTMAPNIVQQEIEFINITTQHVERFTTEGTTVTIEDIETTPYYDKVSVKFTLSGEKISSIQDYDTTKLTTLLPAQTVTFKETTKHIVPPAGAELTTLKEGLIVSDLDDETTTESLGHSTIIPEIDSSTVHPIELASIETIDSIVLAGLDTTSDSIVSSTIKDDIVATTPSEEVTESEAVESGVVMTTFQETSTFDSDSKLSVSEKDEIEDVSQSALTTEKSDEITGEQIAHAVTSSDESISTNVSSSAESSDPASTTIVIHGDQATSSEYSTISKEHPFDLKSTAGDAEDSELDNVTVVPTTESNEDNLHASSGEIHTVTSMLISQTGITELDYHSLNTSDDEIEQTQESESDEALHSTIESQTLDSEHAVTDEIEQTQESESDEALHSTIESQTLDSEHAVTDKTKYTTSGEETHETTYDDLPKVTSDEQSETSDSSTHDTLKTSDYPTSSEAVNTSDSLEILDKISPHSEAEGLETSNQDSEATEISTVHSISDIESSTTSHLDESTKIQEASDIVLSNAETVSNVDEYTKYIETTESSAHETQTSDKETSVHDSEELGSSTASLSTFDVKSAEADISLTSSHELPDSSEESSSKSSDLSTLSFQTDLTGKPELTQTPDTTTSPINIDMSSLPQNSFDLSENTTSDTSEITEATESPNSYSTKFSVTDDSITTESDENYETDYSKIKENLGTSHVDIADDLILDLSSDMSETELIPPATFSSSEIVNDSISTTESVEDSESGKISEGSEILYSKVTSSEDEIQKNGQESSSSSDILETGSTEKIITHEFTSEKIDEESKIASTLEEEDKSTSDQDSSPLTGIDTASEELEVSKTDNIPVSTDMHMEKDTMHTTHQGLHQETSSYQSEDTTNNFHSESHTTIPVSEIPSYSKESESTTEESHATIESITEKSKIDQDSTTSSIFSDTTETSFQSTTEKIENEIVEETLHVKHDPQVFAAHVTTNTVPAVPVEVTSQRLPAEKPATTTESDLPSELPEFEPPLANIMKQQMLHHRPSTEKVSTSTSTVKPQNSQFNFATETSNETNFDKLSLTLEEGSDNTSLIHDDSENNVFVLNNEYTISDSEISNLETFDSTGKDSVSVETEDEINEDTISTIQTHNVNGTSDIPVLDSEEILNETVANKNAAASDISKDSNLLTPTLEENYVHTEQTLPHSVHNIDNSLVENSFEKSSMNDSEVMNLEDHEHESEETIYNLEILGLLNQNNGSTDTIIITTSFADSETNIPEHEASTDVSEYPASLSVDDNMQETNPAELSSKTSVEISNEHVNEEISTAAPNNLQEGNNSLNEVQKSHNETDVEYLDAENSESSNEEKDLSTTISVSNIPAKLTTVNPDIATTVAGHGPEKGGEIFEPPFPEIFPIDSASASKSNFSDSSKETVDSTVEEVASTISDNENVNGGTTVKINVLFGQDTFESYNKPVVHSPNGNNEDAEFSFGNKNIVVNSEISVTNPEGVSNNYAESENSFQRITETPISAAETEESQYSETHSENSLHDLNSEEGFDNIALDSFESLNLDESSEGDLSFGHVSSTSVTESTPEDSMSTDGNSSSSFTILEYLGELFSGVSTFSTLADDNGSIKIQNDTDVFTATSEKLDITTASNDTTSKQSYSSDLLDRFAEYGTLGGVFITGQSKYNKTLSSDSNHNSDNENRETVTDGGEQYSESGLDLKSGTIPTTFSTKKQEEVEGNNFTSEASLNLKTTEQVNIGDMSTKAESSEGDGGLEITADGSKYEILSRSTSPTEATIALNSESINDTLMANIEIKQEGPEKGGEWFESTDPILANAPTDNISMTTISDDKVEITELTTVTDAVHGPEKGGEVFEPSFPSVFPIESAISEIKNDSILNSNTTNIILENTESVTHTSDSVSAKSTVKAALESSSEASLNESVVDNGSTLHSEFIPPLPIMLKNLNKHEDSIDHSKTNDEDGLDDINKPQDPKQDKESSGSFSKVASARSFNHPYYLSDVVSQVFKAPGYDTEVHLDALKGFRSPKKTQRWKRDTGDEPSNTRISNSNTDSLLNRDSSGNPSGEIYSVNTKNVLLVEGYNRKPSGFFPVTSSFIIVQADEDAEENETEIDPKRKSSAAQPEGDLSEKKFLEDISSKDSVKDAKYPEAN